MSCPHQTGDGPCPTCDGAEAHQATFISEARPVAPPADGSLDAGTKIDRYVIHDLIGRGGMGFVYSADDPDLGRQVAIKLLRASAAPGDAASLGQARLMREAQAMALVSHPNVMPVYDVGRYGESVFVAMELVRGLTLDKWVKAKPRPWREVLQMFLQAGRGLQAAHAAGLVHRDFKPANVLIGEDERPRVTDFGIARSLRAVEKPISGDTTSGEHERPSSSSSNLDTPLTRAGALMGSPGYMAPEQYAGLQTSPATDQFSFCVALYEALYGKRPFHGSTLAELAHSATRGQVPPPPKGTSVPPWLHRVIAKGLSPAPEARHASMTALLEALAQDPAQKLRNRLWAAGVVLLVVGSAGAVIGTQVSQQRACRGADALLRGVWDDTARAKGKQAFEATGKSYAPLAWDHARAEMDTYARAWAAARTEACAATRVRGEQTEAVMLARFECLDHRKDELSALAQAYAAADVETVDRAYGAASRLSDIGTCANARADRKQPPPEAKEAVEQLSRELAQGRSLTSAGKFDAARERISSAVQIARAVKLPAQLGEAEYALGELERETRRLAKSNEAHLRAIQNAEAAGDDEVSARALIALVSLVGWRLERPQEGLAFAQLARGKIDRLGGDRKLEAALAEATGDAQWQAGERVAALDSYRGALKEFSALEGPEGIDVVRLRSSIGWVLMEQGHTAEARVELTTAKELREKLLGPDHPSLVASWNELGEIAMSSGETGEAVKCFERALALARAAHGNDSLSTARMALNLAHGLEEDDRAVEGEPLVDHASEIAERHADTPTSFKIQALRARGVIAAAKRQWDDAERFGRAALELASRANGPKHPETAEQAVALARVLAAKRRWAEALELYDRYLSIEEGLGGSADADFALALAESARPLKELGREREAFERLERAVGIVPPERGNHRRAGQIRFLLADALWEKDKARSRQVALQARAELEQAGRKSELETLDGWLKAR